MSQQNFALMEKKLTTIRMPLQTCFKQLTASIWAVEEDMELAKELATILELKAGRVIMNNVPTGVEVTHAMVHGGPFPATTDARTTSVGSAAIYRFTRPVCYQNFSDNLLPDALRNSNPLNIPR